MRRCLLKLYRKGNVLIYIYISGNIPGGPDHSVIMNHYTEDEDSA